MKKWLSILGTIGLTTTSTTSLISCQKPNNNENGGGNNPQQPTKDSNWKLIGNKDEKDINKNNYWDISNKWYFTESELGYFNKFYIIIWKDGSNYKISNSQGLHGTYTNLKAVYRWDGAREPQLPTIDKNTGKIINWKEQKETE